MTEFTSQSLPELYEAACSEFSAASKAAPSSAESLETIQKALDAVDREALFSKNEELDDIPTSSLKYLCLTYFSGFVLSKMMTSRLKNLENAKLYFNRYLEVCSRLGVLHEDELQSMKNKDKLGPEERRRLKIEKYRRHKEHKERYESLKRFLIQVKEDTEIDHEEEIRTMEILQLKLYAQEAIDELESIEQEIPIQKHMLELEEQKRLRGDKENKNSSSFAAPKSLHADPSRPGINVVRMNKVGSQITSTKETIKADVFKPHVPPPTMTLEEFGRLEMEDALQRQRKENEQKEMQKQEGADASRRRYGHLLSEGLEDDADLVDKATINDREWDDWKDNNIRGIGNKMNKRY